MEKRRVWLLLNYVKQHKIINKKRVVKDYLTTPSEGKITIIKNE
jgi:hypothetical protein